VATQDGLLNIFAKAEASDVTRAVEGCVAREAIADLGAGANGKK
jgi:hypothetical protein